MVLAKIDEKTLRVKYLRALEKICKCSYFGFKKENFDKEKFQERMEKNKKIVEKCEAVNLNSSYNKSLENFVNHCLDFSKQKEELLSLANALDKLKKGEKKEKHKTYLKDYYD